MSREELIKASLQALSVILNNPLIGGGSTQRYTEISDMLMTLYGIIDAGENAYVELKAFTQTVQAMAAEGRGPTRNELLLLSRDQDTNHNRLQAVKARILAQQAEDEGGTEKEAASESVVTAPEGSTSDEETGTTPAGP